MNQTPLAQTNIRPALRRAAGQPVQPKSIETHAATVRKALKLVLNDTHRDVIWLFGDIASGKTTLARLICPRPPVVVNASKSTPAALMRVLAEKNTPFVMDEYRQSLRLNTFLEREFCRILRMWRGREGTVCRGTVFRRTAREVRYQFNAAPLIVIADHPPKDASVNPWLIQCRAPLAPILWPPQHPGDPPDESRPQFPWATQPGTGPS